MRVLVVEDNTELAALLLRGLGTEGIDADRAGTAEAAEEALRGSRYAAVILDLGLPDRDGSAVLRDMRARRDSTPVLVLTARGGLRERIAGLQNGADDYLVKPFAFEELVARLRALLRRPGEMLGRGLETANLALDTEGRQAFVDGRAEMMSAQELTLVEILMRRTGKVVPKSYIESQLFGMTSEVGRSAVEVSVYRLRKRLDTMGAKVEIHTVRGLGYLLADTGG